MLSGSQDKTIKAWDLLTGNLVNTWNGNGLSAVSVSSCGRYDLVANMKQNAEIYDVKNDIKSELSLKNSDLTAITISKCGKNSVIGTSSGKVII